MLKEQYSSFWATRIDQCASDDSESKLGVYKQANLKLKPYTTKQLVPEFERIHVTRYRTGSHNLQIENG